MDVDLNAENNQFPFELLDKTLSNLQSDNINHELVEKTITRITNWRDTIQSDYNTSGDQQYQDKLLNQIRTVSRKMFLKVWTIKQNTNQNNALQISEILNLSYNMLFSLMKNNETFKTK
eukprot:280274_1